MKKIIIVAVFVAFTVNSFAWTQEALDRIRTVQKMGLKSNGVDPKSLEISKILEFNNGEYALFYYNKNGAIKGTSAMFFDKSGNLNDSNFAKNLSPKDSRDLLESMGFKVVNEFEHRLK